MPRFSFKIRESEEFISTGTFENQQEALIFFGLRKNLDLDTFNKIYEVIKR